MGVTWLPRQYFGVTTCQDKGTMGMVSLSVDGLIHYNFYNSGEIIAIGQNYQKIDELYNKL